MKNNSVCDCNIIHQHTVDKVQKMMPTEVEKASVAKIFKVLGDSTRMNIMFALLNEEMCVCDISALLNMTKSAISHQLAVLKEVRLVKFEKRGKEVFYSVDDRHVKDVVQEILEHIQHN